MTKKARNALRRFRRVQQFLTTNAVDGTQVKLQALDEVIRSLSESGVEQEASTRLTLGETARQSTLREALWKYHMVPIAQIGRRAIADRELKVKLRLPKKHGDNEKVLAVAGGMAEVAEQHADVFVRQEGLPADFVQQLRAAMAALTNALPVRSAGLDRKSKSREASAVMVKRGVATVDVLNAIVSPRLAGKPDLLAAWKSAKRLVEPGGGSGLGATPDITPVVKVA